MDQEITVLRFQPATGRFEQAEMVGDGAMERHRERHVCRYADRAALTPAQWSAALAVFRGDEAAVVVLKSRETGDLFIYQPA